MQHKSRAQRRMSGEWQLFLHGKNAHAHAANFFRRGVPGKNEGGFGEIHLPRQGLHLFCAETAAIKKYGERVAGESAVGEHIDLHHL